MSTELQNKPSSGEHFPEPPSEATQLGKANQSLFDSEEHFRLLVEGVQDYNTRRLPELLEEAVHGSAVGLLPEGTTK